MRSFITLSAVTERNKEEEKKTHHFKLYTEKLNQFARCAWLCVCVWTFWNFPQISRLFFNSINGIVIFIAIFIVCSFTRCVCECEREAKEKTTIWKIYNHHQVTMDICAFILLMQHFCLNTYFFFHRFFVERLVLFVDPFRMHAHTGK